MLRPWSDSIPPTYSTTKLPPPIRSARRRSPCRGGARAGAPNAGFAPANPLLQQAFPSWARPPKRASRRRRRGLRGGVPRRRRPRSARPNLRLDPPFAGALRQRLALRAATACAALARHREDSSALRDAEHLSRRAGGTRTPAPPAASIGCGACSPRAQRGSTRRRCEPPPIFLDLPDDAKLEGFADALRDVWPTPELRSRRPRARAPRRCNCLADAPRVDAEIFALWLSRSRLGAPARLGRAGSAARDDDRASVVASRPSRQASASRPIPIGRALAPRLRARRAGRYRFRRRSVAAIGKAAGGPPKLRAKGAGRVIEMLLGDDAVSPATAAKAAGCRIAPAAVYSIGWSSSAPCANSPAGRIFGSTACRDRRMSRPKRREQEPLFDPELAELPEGARWREWLGRVEAAIFASRDPCRARRSPRSSGRIAISTISSPTSSTNCARVPMNSVRRRRLAVSHEAALRRRHSRASRTGCATLVSRADADRTVRGHGDRLSATGHSRGIVAPRRQGDQPRHHRPPEASRPHRRRPARARTRRALRLCHDAEILGGVWVGPLARPSRPRTARGRRASRGASLLPMISTACWVFAKKRRRSKTKPLNRNLSGPLAG